MLVWDTHLQGLAVSDSSIRAKPDMLLCQGYAEAANVVSVVEAKSSLIEANNRVDVAFSLLSGWSSYKGLKRSAALGYLLLWETHLWRSGTSSRCLYCMCFSFDPVVQPTPNVLYARAVSPSVWPAEAHANCHASSTA